MRTTCIAGNWKMFHAPSQTQQVLTELVSQLPRDLTSEVIIFPPFVSLITAVEATQNSPIKIGAQTLHQEPQGAFTGEISGLMLADTGCQYVLIGHSERRQYFGETNALTNLKIKAALSSHLIPVLCVGETLTQREANQTMTVINTQLQEGLANIPKNEKLIIAYEPVWAIGTGKVATPDQAQDVHAQIRAQLTTLGFPADTIQILYGGSVKAETTAQLLAQPDIDGTLVGGASLEATSFAAIIQNAQLIAKEA